MKKQLNIHIYELLGSKDAVSSEDGSVLFKEIMKALNEDDIVTLDFNKIESITTAFLNVAIGQLYSKYDSAKLRECLKLENIGAGDLTSLKRVVDRAKQYFIDKENMDNTIDDILNE